MAKSRWLVSLILCTSTLFGSQSETQDQKVLENKPEGVVARTEQALALAGSLVARLTLKTIGFSVRYPRITFLMTAVAPMVVPRYRCFVGRQTSQLVGMFTRRIGQWVQQGFRGWLLAPFNDRLGAAQLGIDEQHKILDGHTGQLTGLHDTIGRISEDTRGLVVEHATLQRKVEVLHEILEEHNPRLKGISEQGSTTSTQVQKVAVSIDELYAQLVKIESRVAEGKTETIDKIEFLEKNLGQLSAEQKKLFEDYGAQFLGRFDQLSESLRLVLGSLSARQVASCSQQYHLTVK